MNKYLTKIASDLEIAKEYHEDEEHDVKKYADELKTAKDPKLVAALQFALPEEKQHAAKFKAAIENIEGNKYAEKAANMVKMAFDVDYEENGEYGIAANRAINNPMVHDMLSRAMKDPHVHVMVDEYSSWKDHHALQRHMDEIKAKLGPSKTRDQHLKDYTHQWDREHVWSMGMKKDDPVVQHYIGKTDRWGDEIEDHPSAILEHLKKHYDK